MLTQLKNHGYELQEKIINMERKLINLSSENLATEGIKQEKESLQLENYNLKRSQKHILS